MNDLTFGATLLSVSVLLVVAVLVEATGAPRHAVKPSAGVEAPKHLHVASVLPRKDCTVVASAAAVR